MQKFEVFTGVVAPLDRANVDTDTIIPKQFLKSIHRRGLGPFAFDNWRYMDEGTLGQNCSQRPLNPDFALNKPRYRDAEILLTRDNFGCGSSREHAAWALIDDGFRTVIAPSFAEIFFSNAIKNGMLPVVLDAKVVDGLFESVQAKPQFSLRVDLAAQTLSEPDGASIEFEIDPEIKRRLLEGLDDIALSLKHADAIRAYEEARAKQVPWLFPDIAED